MITAQALFKRTNSTGGSSAPLSTTTDGHGRDLADLKAEDRSTLHQVCILVCLCTCSFGSPSHAHSCTDHRIEGQPAPQPAQNSQSMRHQLKTLLAKLQMVLKCADIGHLAADPATHKRWSLKLEEEFFRQVGCCFRGCSLHCMTDTIWPLKCYGCVRMQARQPCLPDTAITLIHIMQATDALTQQRRCCRQKILLLMR